MNLSVTMRRHVKLRNTILQHHCINEPYATGTWFSTSTNYEGYKCAQIFYGTRSKVISYYGLAAKSYGPNALLDLSRQEGVPLSTTRHISKMQSSAVFNYYMRKFWVKDRFIEPYSPKHNLIEREAMVTHKGKL